MIDRPAITHFPIWGTTATVMAADPERLITACMEIERQLEDIGRTCSRFREDSDISRVNANAGSWTAVDALFIEALDTALGGACATDGLVDPTVGGVMHRIGYDRDLADIPALGPPLPRAEPAPGWRTVEIRRDDQQVRIPKDSSLDLGATAKAFGADHCAARAVRVADCGVLVSLGGDIATSGPAPAGGWRVGIADDHRGSAEPGETVRIDGGGLATSSVTVRRWNRDGTDVHHIVDPRTGETAPVIWRTVSVAAGTCVDANIAATAAIVMGTGAPGWLASRDLPARLVRADGEIVRVGAWPEKREDAAQ